MKKITTYLIVIPVLAALTHALVSLSASTPVSLSDNDNALVTTPTKPDADERAASSPININTANSDNLKQALQNTSLADTQPPATPLLDAEGNLQRNRELRDIFDYFLSLSGEQRDEDIHQLIETYLAQHLPPHAVMQAMQTLVQYQTLNQRLTTLSQTMEGDDLQAKLEQLASLRREILGEALATAFFGEEEAYDRYSLEMLAQANTGDGINNATSVNATSLNANSINALESLPAGLRDRQRERLQQQHLLKGTQRLEKAGASAAELYQFHLLNGNAAIAERYQALAAQREHWQQRFTAFQVQRESITQLPLSSEEKTTRINQLLAESFNETEILRVRTLENMESL